MEKALRAAQEMAPYVESCLLLQSFFLNILWIVLLWGWVISQRKYPRDAMLGGVPSRFHWAIAGLVWVITFGVALYEFEPQYWFLGLAIAGGVFLSVLSPGFSICFTLAMLLMRPWEIMPENALALALPRFSMFFTLGWSLLYFVVADRFAIRVNRVLILLLGYTLWIFATAFVTPSPDDAIYGISETMGRAVMLFFLIYHLVRDRFSLWALKTTIVSIFSCVGLIAISFYIDGYKEDGRIIAFGLFKNSNDIAAVMCILVYLGASPFFQRASGWLARSIALVPVGISLAVITLSQSRGAVLSVVVAAAYNVIYRMKRKMLAIVIALAVVGGGQVVIKGFSRNSGDLEGSANSRMSFWISGMRMALYNPVLGVGYGQFPSNFEKYALEIVGEYGHRTAHSSWILALAEGGPIGLLLFAALFVIGSIKSCHFLYREDASWLLATVAYWFAISFLSHTYMLFPYIMMAAVTAGVAAVSASSDRELVLREHARAAA